MAATPTIAAMPHVWKTTPMGRIGAVIAGLLFVAYSFAVDGPVTIVVMTVLAAAAVWLLAFWPAITLTGAEVVVRNPWGTRRIPLTGIAGVGAGWAGLSIRRVSGPPVTAWAVQKSNGAKWSGRQTRADEVATAIASAANHPTVRSS